MLPSTTDMTGMGQLQKFTHQATLIFLNEHVAVDVLKPEVLSLLQQYENIHAGLTRPAFNGLLIRVLGQQAEQLLDCLQHLSKLISSHLKTAKIHAV